MKIMVAYDGTLQAQEALKYGISKAKEKGAELVVQHVFNADMFSDYDATPNAREAARDESARFVAEAESIIREKAKGVKASIVTMEGNPESEVLSFAKEEDVDILLCPPKYRGIIAKYRAALEKEGRTVDVADAAGLKLATVAAKN
jgi:nucleotide-binding universal stress UspA family protein